MHESIEERKMKVIALAGAYNSGKTSVLKALIATLIGNGGRHVVASVTHGKDVRCAIAYKAKVIGVCSGGDDKKTVDANFKFFAANNCDTGITACRSVANCSSVDAVKNNARNLKSLPFYVGKMREKRCRMAAVDAQTAQQLISMI